MYFYHPDHLGSSSYITDREGRITQHTEYIAFGEVLFEEHSTSKTMPYLFNGKELDTETGLYYYGANMSEGGEGIGNIGKISIAAGMGAISGTAKFTKWAGSSNGRKILVKMLEVGLDALEDIMKQYIETGGENIDLKATLISTITDIGMGKILEGTKLSKHISKQESMISKAQKEINNIKNSNIGTTKGQAKK